MWYEYEITVDANTAQTDPKVDKKKLDKGVITRVSFRPRPGHSAVCHCQVRFHETQLFPINPDGDLHGDRFPMEWDEFIELKSEPYEVRIISWNTSTSYAHTYDIGFCVLPKWAALPFAITKTLSDIASLLSPRRILGGSS